MHYLSLGPKIQALIDVPGFELHPFRAGGMQYTPQLGGDKTAMKTERRPGVLFWMGRRQRMRHRGISVTACGSNAKFVDSGRAD
jgi:hypothetical protein